MHSNPCEPALNTQSVTAFSALPSVWCHWEMKSSVRASKGQSRASPALPRTPTDCTARLESPAWSAAPGEHDLWVCICSFVWLLCLAAVYGYCTLLAVIYLHICAVLVASFHNLLLCHFAASFLLFAVFLGRVLLILCYLDVFVVVLDS